MKKWFKRFSQAFSLVFLLGVAFYIQSAAAEGEKSFLWKVQSKTSTVYILGSVHFMKKEAYPLSRKIEEAFDTSDILVVEANVIQQDESSLQRMLKSALYEGSDTLAKEISPETYGLLQKELPQFGITIEIADKQRPWFLALTLTSLKLMNLGCDPNYGIDMYFLSKATGRKKILELEGLDYQTGLFSAFSKKEQELMLLSTLKDLTKVEDNIGRIMRSWTSGDTQGMDAAMRESFQEDKRMFSVYEKLIYERNKIMAAKIEDYLKTKSSYFVVVGAGHLVGERGVVELLRGRGYQVNQM